MDRSCGNRDNKKIRIDRDGVFSVLRDNPGSSWTGRRYNDKLLCAHHACSLQNHNISRVKRKGIATHSYRVLDLTMGNSNQGIFFMSCAEASTTEEPEAVKLYSGTVSGAPGNGRSYSERLQADRKQIGVVIANAKKLSLRD